jgi:hypothetical protein
MLFKYSENPGARSQTQQHPVCHGDSDVGHILFIDITICRRPHGSLDHNEYRKGSYTNLSMNAESYYHPANKQSLM